MHVSSRLSALAATAVVVSHLYAPSAEACGGFFCSNSPVDQNAERILFEVHPPPEGVTAVVEISYTGDPDAFSWIVPVPETPVLDVVPLSTLRLLDSATQPRIIAPPTTCENGRDDDLAFADGAAEPDPSPSAEPGVVVEDLPQVGAFDPEVISSEDPQALINWLNDNNYLITAGMEPFVEQYVNEGYKFLGLKLAPDQGVADISPIKFTCPSEMVPLVPIRLTGVSAEPEMGILTFVAGAERYAPQNFRNLEVNPEQLQWDYNSRTSNYYPLVSWLIDQEGGKAFVTQFSDSSDETQSLVDNTFLPLTPEDDDASREYLRGVFDEFSTITRLYTRMSGWEMDDDPVFAPAASLGPVDRTLDLSDREPVEICGDVDVPLAVPCGDTYCGEGAMCASTVEGRDGCLCGDGSVARQITAPVGAGRALRQTVVCQDASLNLISAEDLFDPCDGFTCGDNGSCVGVNGFPTCRCDTGFAAITNFSQPRGVSCVATGDVFEPTQLDFVETNTGGSSNPAVCECTSSSSETSTLLGLGLLLGLGVGLRRRRR